MPAPSQPRPCDPEVVRALREWCHAADVHHAMATLRLLRTTLSPLLLKQFAEHAALINVKLLQDILQQAGPMPADMQLTDVPAAVRPAVTAWLVDQQQSADALGLEPDAWLETLTRALETLELHGLVPIFAAWVEKEHGAGRLLGTEKGTFENRPQPGTSAQAGLRGLIAARMFSADDKKRG